MKLSHDKPSQKSKRLDDRNRCKSTVKIPRSYFYINRNTRYSHLFIELYKNDISRERIFEKMLVMMVQ